MTAKEYFSSQAYFNKWLKELTATEQMQITQMLGEFSAITLHQLITNNSESFEDGEYFAVSAVKIDDLMAKIEEVNGDKVIICPSCGYPWNTTRNNACKCGAIICNSKV